MDDDAASHPGGRGPDEAFSHWQGERFRPQDSEDTVIAALVNTPLAELIRIAAADRHLDFSVNARALAWSVGTYRHVYRLSRLCSVELVLALMGGRRTLEELAKSLRQAAHIKAGEWSEAIVREALLLSPTLDVDRFVRNCRHVTASEIWSSQATRRSEPSPWRSSR